MNGSAARYLSALVLAAIFLVVLVRLTATDRYSIVGPTHYAGIMKLDRWTGEVVFIELDCPDNPYEMTLHGCSVVAHTNQTELPVQEIDQ